MRSKYVKNGFLGSKTRAGVAGRGQTASLEPFKATKEAIGGPKTAFWKAFFGSGLLILLGWREGRGHWKSSTSNLTDF